MRTAVVKISLTETGQFRRLVQFLEDVENVGRVNCDDEINAMVADCRSDLLADALPAECFVCGQPMPDAELGERCWFVPGRGSAHDACYEPPTTSP